MGRIWNEAKANPIALVDNVCSTSERLLCVFSNSYRSLQEEDEESEEEATARKARRPTVERVGATLRSPSICLETCFELFLKEELLSERDPWRCPKCKEFRQVRNKTRRWLCWLCAYH